MQAAQLEKPPETKANIHAITSQSSGGKKLVPGVNATDIAFHEIRVPKHPYSQTCYCDACTAEKSPALFSNEPTKYGATDDKWKPQDIRYALITELECKSFMLPRGYLRRWFVGGKLFIGGISPKGYLVCGMALSAPGAFGKRFTSKNTLEVRRMFMEDCCEKNCESAFIAWVCRFIKSRCPQIKYIITFGDPRYDKETPYLAAGFTKELAKNSNDWSTHKSHRSRESPTDKIRLVWRTWAKDIVRSNVPGMRQESLPFNVGQVPDSNGTS